MSAAVLRTIGVAVSLVFASAAFGADESGAPVPKPEVKVDDRWTYRVLNYQTNVPTSTTSETRVTFVGPDEILTVTTRSDGRETEVHWTSEWNIISSGVSGRVFAPSARVRKFPLKAGATYETAYELVAQRGSSFSGKLEVSAKVGAWEDVVVPAGKFRALKVEAKGTLQRLDQPGGGWFRDEFWYVPEVKRWVKSSYEEGARGSFTPDRKQEGELLEFKLQ